MRGKQATDTLDEIEEGMALRQKQAEADAATFQEALEEAAAMHDVRPPAPMLKIPATKMTCRNAVAV